LYNIDKFMQPLIPLPDRLEPRLAISGSRQETAQLRYNVGVLIHRREMQSVHRW